MKRLAWLWISVLLLGTVTACPVRAVFTGVRSRTVKNSRSTAIQTSTEPVTWTHTSPAGRWVKYWM